MLKPGSVVVYNNKRYLFLGLNSSNKSRLLNTDLSKYSGTPNPDKLQFDYMTSVRMFNNHLYSFTKHGVISLTTGEIMSDKYVDDINRLGTMILRMVTWFTNYADADRYVEGKEYFENKNYSISINQSRFEIWEVK